MLFHDFCTKVIYWPYLTHLAILKGLCPTNNSQQPLQPVITSPRPVFTILPTFHPIPGSSTLSSCPLEPLICFENGESPIAFCPCIDPRVSEGKFQMSSLTTTDNQTLEKVDKNVIIYHCRDYYDYYSTAFL